jgi:hypothetical protein
LWSALIAGLAGLGFGVAAYQTWMQAYPHLAPECSFTDPNAIERLVDWLGMQCRPCFWQPASAPAGIGSSWSVDGQLVDAVLCRYRRLRNIAVPSKARA